MQVAAAAAATATAAPLNALGRSIKNYFYLYFIEVEMLQMSTSWSDDDAEMPMSAGHWILNWLDIVYSILDAAYFYSYFAR